MRKSVDSGTRKRKKIALGRGFDALIPDIGVVEDEFTGFRACDTDLIQPNRYQPRVEFASDELEDLCGSIRTHGILQPLLVREHENGFELIAGERRLRAAKMAGLTQVPIVVKDISDSELLELSIIENIQRQNLNPLEESQAYHRLMTDFDMTQEEVARRVGKSRSAVANFLRLRQLPEMIKASLREGALSMGHARALLGAETTAMQMAAWREVVAKGLSVRATEVLIQRLKSTRRTPPKPPTGTLDVHLSDLAEGLSRDFGTRVQIRRRGQRGRVEIEFYSNDDLDRLIQRLQGAAR